MREFAKKATGGITMRMVETLISPIGRSGLSSRRRKKATAAGEGAENLNAGVGGLG